MAPSVPTALYERLFDEAPVGLALLDPAAANQAVTVNRRMCDLLGRSADDLLALRSTQYTHPEDRHVFDEYSACLLAGRDHPDYITTRYLRPDGEVLAACVTARVVRDDEHLYLLAEVQPRPDTADARRVLDEGRRPDALTFVYAAAHDLQEPLGALGASLDLLHRNHAESLDADGLTLAGHALDSARHANDLVADLHHLAAANTIDDSPRTVDLDQVVRRALAALWGVIRDRGAEVDHAGPLGVAPGNAWALTRLMQNLVSNAIKFTPPERHPRIRISSSRRDRWLDVDVSDNAIGIHSNDQAEIFQPLTRLHPHIPGTGMGLAIVRQVAVLHRATVHIASQPGVGSTFTVSLPIG